MHILHQLYQQANKECSHAAVHKLSTKNHTNQNHTMTFMQRPATPGCPAACQRGLPGEDVITNNMYMEREDQQALPNQLPNPYMSYNSYRFPVGMNFYEALDKTITDPFIPIRDLQNLHGIVRPRTKFIGNMLKLGGNLVWNYRTFTIDGQYFSCFYPERLGTNPPTHPLSLPSAKMIDTVLPDGDTFFRYTPKWVLPISRLTGIYILENVGLKNINQPATPQRILALAEDCVMGLQDPCEDLRWTNLLHFVANDGKVQLDRMRRLSFTAVQHALLLVDRNQFYVLRAHSREDLYTWMTVLCGKWVIFNRRWDYYNQEVPLIYS